MEDKNPTLSDHCLTRNFYQRSASWKERGRKSVRGSYDLVSLFAARWATRAGTWRIFDFYVFFLYFTFFLKKKQANKKLYFHAQIGLNSTLEQFASLQQPSYLNSIRGSSNINEGFIL